MSSFRKIKDFVIYCEEQYHSAMPSVVKLDDGEILVAFRRAPDRRILGKKQITHIDSNSNLMLVRSRDNAETWSKVPELLCAHPWGGSQDPCLFQLNDGSILCTSYSWIEAESNYAKNDRRMIRIGNHLSGGGFLLRSNDGGHNWSAPEAAPRLQHNQAHDHLGNSLPVFNRGTMAQDEHGRIYWGVTRHNCMHPARGSIELLVSDDGGRSWVHLSTIAEDTKVSFNECSLYFTEGGDLCCFIRSFGIDDHTVLARSKDKGKTFQPWIDAGWPGNPHHALRLQDDRVLLVYGYRRDPIGIRARILEPECNDIKQAQEFIIRDDGGSWDVGYPWSILLDNGSVLVVYYFNIDDGTRFIAGSVLRIT